MRNGLTRGMIVAMLGLVLSAFTGIAVGQDFDDRTAFEGIILNKTNPEIILGPDFAIPAVATAEFKIYDFIEINTDSDIITVGTVSGRQWGSLQIVNTQDSSHTVLGNISETMKGDSFTKPEYPEIATWNSTYIHWIYPPDIVVNEQIDWRTEIPFMVDYKTSALTTIYNPVTLTRYVNRSVFSSDGFQFNSYELNFENNLYEDYSGRIAYTATNYTNSSILFNTFTTDLPLTSLTNRSYLDPVTNQYISELGFNFNNTSIQVHRPYHFNVTASIKLTNNAGIPVKNFPRVFFALDRTGPIQQGDVGMTAVMPSALHPAHVTQATATTNVSNLWQYRHIDDVKLAFNQTAKLMKKAKIGVFRNGLWFLDASGNGAYGAGDVAFSFGKAGDIPVTGDWNNDGKTEIGVVRNNNTWLSPSVSGNEVCIVGYLACNFGKVGDVPVTGDWNNDGKTEIGVVRNGNTWYLDASGNGVYGAGDLGYAFGKAGDVYVTGDWNNDGKTEIGVVRNSMSWLLDASGDGKYGAGDLSYSFGKAGDSYVTGDWNNDGKTEIGVVRNSNIWYLDASGDGRYGVGDLVYTFGKAGDKYVTGKWS